jgi:hypothetical protein
MAAAGGMASLDGTALDHRDSRHDGPLHVSGRPQVPGPRSRVAGSYADKLGAPSSEALSVPVGPADAAVGHDGDTIRSRSSVRYPLVFPLLPRGAAVEQPTQNGVEVLLMEGRSAVAPELAEGRGRGTRGRCQR